MVTEKSCIRWGSRIIFEYRGSVKSYSIFKNTCSLVLLFAFGRERKILLKQMAGQSFFESTKYFLFSPHPSHKQ